MGLQRFPLGGFKGGMNLTDNPYALKSGEAQIATDVDLGLRDVLSSRKGFTGVGLTKTIASQTRSPGRAINDSSLGGAGHAWASPGSALVSNDSRASCSFVTAGSRIDTFSQGLRWDQFGFALPAGAVPVGWKIEAERRKNNVGGEWGPSNVFGNGFQMIKENIPVGGFHEDNGAHFNWTNNADEVFIYGSAEDLFGQTLTKAQVEDPNFGCRTWVSLSSSDGHEIKAEFDAVTVTVYYLTEGIGNDAADHMRPWYTGTDRHLMMSSDGDIKFRKGGSVEITELMGGVAGSTWCFEQMEYNPGAGFKDSIWMMNGPDTPVKWDGTTLEIWNGKPPKGTMLRVWKNRMIVSGVAKFPQRVFFSEPGDPQKPEDETNGGYGNNWIDIRTSEDDIDPVVWLEVLDDVLLVFKKKSVNAITDSESFSFQRIANVGCEGRFQSCVLDDRAYFVNRTGVYSVTAQGALRYESLNIEPIFKGTGPEGLEGIDLNLLATSGRMCSLSNGRVYLACTPKGSLANRWLLECYPRLRGEVEGDRTPWVKHSFAGRCIKSICNYRSTDEEVDKVAAGVTNESGKSPELVYLFDSLRDGLEPIEWRWVSGFKSMISEEPFERVRRLNLLMKGRLKARIISDGKPRAWKTLESVKEELKGYRPEAKGRYHALELTETGQTATSVYKGEFAIRGGKEHK